uniref:Uncharacterized protein n=1 Tax=Arundo donax TaxID=35708 RepID=A0A0A8XPX9_ARUDO
MFFPYWRSVLLDRCLVRVYPAYAPAPVMFEFDPKVLMNSRRDSMGNGSSTNPNHNLMMLGRTQQPASNHQPRSLFTTAAFTGYGCSRNPNHNLGLLERIRQPTNSHQTRRLFSSAAFLLKLLKNA